MYVYSALSIELSYFLFSSKIILTIIHIHASFTLTSCAGLGKSYNSLSLLIYKVAITSQNCGTLNKLTDIKGLEYLTWLSHDEHPLLWLLKYTEPIQLLQPHISHLLGSIFVSSLDFLSYLLRRSNQEKLQLIFLLMIYSLFFQLTRLKWTFSWLFFKVQSLLNANKLGLYNYWLKRNTTDKVEEFIAVLGPEQKDL